MKHFMKSFIIGVVTITTFLVASWIMNENNQNGKLITSNEIKKIEKLPNNAVQTLTAVYRETNN